MKLSIIIPFGLSKERIYIKDRVIQKACEFKSDDKVEYIFVEGYSSLENDLRHIIKAKGHMYLKDESQKEFFSQGKCRNLGASFANSDVVMFLDVDCYFSTRSLETIMQLITVKNISKNINEFLVLPVVYLSKEGSEFIYTQEKDLWDSLIKDDLISGKREWIKYFSLSSSSLILNKHKFLTLGGNNEEFIGHSYEDHDFLARLLFETTSFEKMPRKLCYDEGSWNIKEFKGFRTWFSLFGYEMSFHGVYMYHFYHDEPNQNNYMGNRIINHKKFYDNLKKIKHYSVASLQDRMVINKNILLLCSSDKLILNSIKDVSVYLGKIQSKSEKFFFNEEQFDKDKFLKFIQDNHIECILFPNPYGNEKRLIIYEFVRCNGLKFICYDRGALPDSWFFDNNGFNYDSSTYKEENWNKNLTIDEINECKKYIKKVLNEDNFLEKQGKRDLEKLKNKLNIKDKKIVFVPLQVENDTVIKYFTYAPFEYNNFLKIINKMAKQLEYSHVFIIKKHPLTYKVNKTSYDSLIFVEDDTNIIDLINMCDVVLTLNSGVGIYAMMMNKPCINCAFAFYAINEVNYQALNNDELLKYLKSDLSVDYEKVIKFIHYLKNSVYSFGDSKYKVIRKNNRIYSKVYETKYYRINIGLKNYLDVQNINKIHYSLKSLIYRPYINEINRAGIMVKVFNLIFPDFIKLRIMHTRFYKLFRKLVYNPKQFFQDRRNKKYGKKAN
ncbi:capsular biosynthesis protein [Campylobacter sp. P255]|uniref:capsular polysaccharide export protein, LipB/KpsS family n=1 Tax=Campylobacter sp. P255 TaxID=1979368 RepID=UPI000EAA0712|nr:capsular biosynthesis protein [Campylobacter sp. P255]RKO64174.1 capsular biosynthesis protein [Campylobacter sp. P255]